MILLRHRVVHRRASNLIVFVTCVVLIKLGRNVCRGVVFVSRRRQVAVFIHGLHVGLLFVYHRNVVNRGTVSHAMSVMVV